ncbi:MAG: hypothetical protein WCF36_04275 [Candidatus Nanopelagicales bacterium]
MSQQPYAPGTDDQPDRAGGDPRAHDTTALPRDPQGYSGWGPGYPPGHGYAPGYPPVNHEAVAWQQKFARQRTRTRIAVALAALTSVAALVLGVATWQLASNPLFGSASDIIAGAGSGDLNLDDLLPGDAAPDSDQPGDGQPDSSVPDTSAPGQDIPLSELPLPDSLKSLASALGITDLGQLLDLAVANGMMSQAEADQLLAALAATDTVGSGQ